jgi:hypothetical protein
MHEDESRFLPIPIESGFDRVFKILEKASLLSRSITGSLKHFQRDSWGSDATRGPL